MTDTAFALACNSYDRPAVATHADIRFLRSTRLGAVLTATAVERARFGRNGLYDVTDSTEEVVVAEFREDGRVAAHH